MLSITHLRHFNSTKVQVNKHFQMTSFTPNAVKVLTVSVFATFVSELQLNLATALTLLGNSAIVCQKGELVFVPKGTFSCS